MEISRLKQAARKQGARFLNRIFSKEELAQMKGRKDPYQGLAARFAAKEAVIKAFGPRRDAPKTLRQIKVVTTSSGAPQVRLSQEGLEVLISMSHSSDYAVASALLLKK